MSIPVGGNESFALRPKAYARTRRLIKLAFSIGARSEGAVHSHARRALEEGLSAEELRQVAALAITSLGFPAAMAGLSWVNDILKDEG